MGPLALGCIASILLGSLVLLPEARTLRVRRPATPVEPKPDGLAE